MNTAQRIILSLFIPLAVVALMFVLDFRETHSVQGSGSGTYTTGISLAYSPTAWLIAVVAVGLFEWFLWRTPAKGRD